MTARRRIHLGAVPHGKPTLVVLFLESLELGPELPDIVREASSS